MLLSVKGFSNYVGSMLLMKTPYGASSTDAFLCAATSLLLEAV